MVFRLRQQFRPRARLVVQRLPVENVPQIASFRVLAFFFIESLTCLIAQPLLLEHLVDERRQPHIGALVLDLRSLCREVLRHMRHHVDAHHIAQPKGPRLRPPDRCTSQRVHLFDREPLRLHQTNRIAHRERADAVRNEVRCVVRVDNRLPQSHIAEVFDRSHIGRIGVRRRDDLEQPHVARRIEKMRAEPVPAQLQGHPVDNLMNRQPARVAGDDRLRPAMLLHLIEKRPLDFHALRDDLNDPIAPGDQR